jgi:hypothetical protein
MRRRCGRSDRPRGTRSQACRRACPRRSCRSSGGTRCCRDRRACPHRSWPWSGGTRCCRDRRACPRRSWPWSGGTRCCRDRRGCSRRQRSGRSRGRLRVDNRCLAGRQGAEPVQERGHLLAGDVRGGAVAAAAAAARDLGIHEGIDVGVERVVVKDVVELVGRVRAERQGDDGGDERDQDKGCAAARARRHEAILPLTRHRPCSAIRRGSPRARLAATPPPRRIRVPARAGMPAWRRPR